MNSEAEYSFQELNRLLFLIRDSEKVDIEMYTDEALLKVIELERIFKEKEKQNG